MDMSPADELFLIAPSCSDQNDAIHNHKHEHKHNHKLKHEHNHIKS